MGVGAATTLATDGCAVNNPLRSEKTPAARAVRDLEPDVAVAVEAATLLRAAVTAVTATGERHPGLAPRLAGALAAHRAHLDRVVAAVAQVGTSEQSRHDGLVGLARRARSGPFARRLGSMAAATAQQLRGLAR